MSKDRPATSKEIAELEAITVIVERHAAETKKIMESNGPTAMLQLALSDATAAKALFALDPEGLSAALALVEDTQTEKDNLIATLKSLVDLGEGDAVARALKNVTLGAVMKNTGVKPVDKKNNGSKITAGGNGSQIKFNGLTVKRNPTKSFDTAADKVAKISQTLGDSENINTTAKSILREAMARQTDGRLVNPTLAAATLATTPIGKGRDMNKQQYDNEETWTNYARSEAEAAAKREAEATGRMKGETPAAKSVEIPAIRMPSYDSKDLINLAAKEISRVNPYELKGVNQSEVVPQVGFNLGATVDVVNPNGSAHGPITFTTDGTQPAVAGQTANYGFPMKDANFPNKENNWDVNLKDPKTPASKRWR